MKRLLLTFLLGVLSAAAITYWFSTDQTLHALAKAAELEGVISSKDKELLGYTNYTNYLTVSKQSLTGQTKLLTASVIREEGVTQVIEASLLGIHSNASIAIWYRAEYSFGFDLRPETYDIKPSRGGIEVTVSKPIMVAPAAVTNLRHKILVGGVLPDEKNAIIKLMEQASKTAQEHGLAMASEPAIQALCEKKLIAFLTDFLSKQAHGKAVSRIKITYR